MNRVGTYIALGVLLGLAAIAAGFAIMRWLLS